MGNYLNALYWTCCFILLVYWVKLIALWKFLMFCRHMCNDGQCSLIRLFLSIFATYKLQLEGKFCYIGKKLVKEKNGICYCAKFHRNFFNPCYRVGTVHFLSPLLLTFNLYALVSDCAGKCLRSLYKQQLVQRLSQGKRKTSILLLVFLNIISFLACLFVKDPCAFKVLWIYHLYALHYVCECICSYAGIELLCE